MTTDIQKLEKDGFVLIKNFASCYKIDLNETDLPLKNVRFCLNKIPSLKNSAEIISSFLKNWYNALYFNRSIYFNKNKSNDWNVLWHQDLTLAVKEKFDHPEFGPWSVKEKIDHVQPPIEILSNMITARFHFNRCDHSNGALKVIPGSHYKIFSREEIEALDKSSAHTCEADAGDLLILKPLILHSSDSLLDKEKSRSILHLEFLTRKPPDFLKLYHSQNIL